MTNTEAYNIAMNYQTFRARNGMAKEKEFWTKELRIMRRVVDHEIIMSRGKDSHPRLAESYADLQMAVNVALKAVVPALRNVL